MKGIVRFGLCMVVLAAAACGEPASTSDRLRLAVGQRGNWDTSVAELGQRAGIFRKHGLELELLYTQGGGETLQAVISNSVDIGIAPGIMGTLSAFAKGAPVRIISAEATGAADLYWYVRSDSPIQSLREANGRTIAYSTNGSSTHGVVTAFLDQYGITAVPTATGGPPATLTQVMSGQIDIGWAAPPFGFQQLDENQIRLLATGDDAEVFKGQTVRVNAVHARTLETKRDAIERFMRAYRETVDWMYAGDEALEHYAAFNNISLEAARRSRDQFFPKAALDPDRVVGLNVVIPDAVKFKYLDVPLTESQLAELIQIPPR